MIPSTKFIFYKIKIIFYFDKIDKMIWILMLVICVGCVFGNSHNETYKLDVNHRVTYRGRERLKLAVQCPVGQLLDSVNLTNTSTNYVLNWFKNDRKLNPFTARRLRFDPDGLRIDATARLGSVRFYCELITGSGIALKSANLTLQYIDGKYPYCAIFLIFTSLTIHLL